VVVGGGGDGDGGGVPLHSPHELRHFSANLVLPHFDRPRALARLILRTHFVDLFVSTQMEPPRTPSGPHGTRSLSQTLFCIGVHEESLAL